MLAARTGAGTALLLGAEVDAHQQTTLYQRADDAEHLVLGRSGEGAGTGCRQQIADPVGPAGLGQDLGVRSPTCRVVTSSPSILARTTWRPGTARASPPLSSKPRS